jgi:hypothetical protein
MELGSELDPWKVSVLGLLGRDDIGQEVGPQEEPTPMEGVENVEYGELDRLRKFVLRPMTPCLFGGVSHLNVCRVFIHRGRVYSGGHFNHWGRSHHEGQHFDLRGRSHGRWEGQLEGGRRRMGPSSLLGTSPWARSGNGSINGCDPVRNM